MWGGEGKGGVVGGQCISLNKIIGWWGIEQLFFVQNKPITRGIFCTKTSFIP